MSEHLVLMEFYIREKIREPKSQIYGDKNRKILEKELTPVNEYQREY